MESNKLWCVVKTTTNNPIAVSVTAEISLHTAVNAILEFAQKFPLERLPAHYVEAIETAADILHERFRKGE